MKNILNALELVRTWFAAGSRQSPEDWRRDPLGHPALRAMDQRELADLPIGHPVLPKRLAEGGC